MGRRARGRAAAHESVKALTVLALAFALGACASLPGDGEIEWWEIMEADLAAQWPDETELDSDIWKCWPSLVSEQDADAAASSLWFVCDAEEQPVLDGFTCRLYLQDFVADERAVCR